MIFIFLKVSLKLPIQILTKFRCPLNIIIFFAGVVFVLICPLYFCIVIADCTRWLCVLEIVDVCMSWWHFYNTIPRNRIFQSFCYMGVHKWNDKLLTMISLLNEKAQIWPATRGFQWYHFYIFLIFFSLRGEYISHEGFVRAVGLSWKIRQIIQCTKVNAFPGAFTRNSRKKVNVLVMNHKEKK